VLDFVVGLVRQHDDAGLLRRVRAAARELPECVFVGDAGLQHAVDELCCLGRRPRVPELLEGGVDRRRRLRTNGGRGRCGQYEQRETGQLHGANIVL
jgi:hypothetical protein